MLILIKLSMNRVKMDLKKFKEVEEKWRNYWKRKGIYRFVRDKNKPLYSIDTPPPTVSGEIHMGHVYGYVQQDFTARFRRMNGFNVFYPFGFDDNGIATERLVEKISGVKANSMSREEFNKLCLEVTENVENRMRDLWEKLGLSVDWSLLYRTISPEVIKISQLSFLELYRKNLIYRKKGPTFFCPECSTAVSQVELEDKEVESYFNDIIFRLKDGGEIKISTTRPELLPACVAIFIHPEDERKNDLVGKKAIVPLFNYEVPILEDSRVDREKGTGIVMCCTFGDQTDIDWYYAHNLPLRIAINERGKMTELAGKYEGLSVKEAREKIVEDLEKEGFLSKRRKIVHNVNVHERCGSEIEFLVSEQWFIKVLENKEKWLELGNKLEWFPKHMKSRYDNWVKGLQWDWCISRQRYFGVPFPLWYCKKCNKVILSDEKNLPVNPLTDKPDKKCECGSNEFIPEKDVMDTWATSSLTPLINAKWDGKNLEEVYPMTLRPQGHDIISFWLFHTVVKCYYHTEMLPFRDVVINGWVLDEKGRKMSKSKGNIISPVDLLNKYPVDAIRFWSCGYTMGEDVPFKTIDLINGEKFMRKIVNAFKFSEKFIMDDIWKPEKINPVDLWILIKVDKLIRDITDYFNNYEYYKVKNELRNVFWHLFCDNYLEMVKKRLYEKKEGYESAIYTLKISLENMLKLLAPVMPYLSEEIYQKYFKKGSSYDSIHLCEWPKPLNIGNNEIEFYGDLAVKIISLIRKYKSERNLPMNSELEEVIVNLNEKIEIPEEIMESIKDTMNVKNLKFSFEEPDRRIREIKMDYKKAGPKYGRLLNKIEDKLRRKDFEVNDNSVIVKIDGKKIVLRDEIKIQWEIDVKGYDAINEEIVILIKRN